MSTTPSTPNLDAPSKGRRTRVRLDQHASQAPHANAEAPAPNGLRRRELGRTLGLVVMAALMGLTSLVVASVSTWLVPVYVTAMVLIFALPRSSRPEESAKGGEFSSSPRGTLSDAAREANGPSRDGQDIVAGVSPPPENSDEASAATAGPSGPPAKPRRSRSRPRKTAKPNVEPPAPPVPATWIQVAPGKFVRADLQEPASSATADAKAPAEAEPASTPAARDEATTVEAVVNDHGPAMEDRSAEPLLEPEEETVPTTEETPADASAEADPMESALSDSQVNADEIDSWAEATATEPPREEDHGPSDVEPDVEAYGNAPSAFDEVPTDDDSSDAAPDDEVYGNAPSAFDDGPADDGRDLDHDSWAVDDAINEADDTDRLGETAEAWDDSEFGPNPDDEFDVPREFPHPGVPESSLRALEGSFSTGPHGSDETSPAQGGNEGSLDQVRISPRPFAPALASRQSLHRPRVSRQSRNLRDGSRDRGPHATGEAASNRARSLSRRRSLGRAVPLHRNFQARSPPSRGW